MSTTDGLTEMPHQKDRGPHPDFALTGSPAMQQALTEMGLLTHLIPFPVPPVLQDEAVAAVDSQCVLITTDLDDATVWQRALLLGADFVCVLPDGEPWLRSRVAR